VRIWEASVHGACLQMMATRIFLKTPTPNSWERQLWAEADCDLFEGGRKEEMSFQLSIEMGSFEAL
jgi:hypothetical protein